MATLPSFDLDPTVIAAAQAGDANAHATIYSHYGDRIYTLIYRLIPRRAAAEDLLHEVFIEVLRGVSSYTSAGSFGGWLRSIAVNKCLAHLRSPWHRGMLWLDDSQMELAAIPSHDTMLDAQADLAAALQRLSAIARAVVWLHDVEGYTHAEIGQALGRTVSFSKSQLARAHTQLRALLAVSDLNLPAHETLPCTPAPQSLSNNS